MTKVIGSQTDVPDIGDPIVSPWYQDTAKKIVHVFATTTARDAWVSPPDGAVCEAPAGYWWHRVGGVWAPMARQVDGGFNAISNQTFTTIGIRDLLTFTIPAVGFPTLMTMQAAVGYASDSSAVKGNPEMQRMSDGGVVGMGATTTQGTTSWGATPLVWSWAVGAGADPSYKLRITLDQFTGVAYVTAQSSWTRYRN
ncbi:MAG TPA: hypothetical protein VGH94_12045 [Acidimicrobiales bacterium]|jgi:hypothetical protein